MTTIPPAALDALARPTSSPIPLLIDLCSPPSNQRDELSRVENTIRGLGGDDKGIDKFSLADFVDTYHSSVSVSALESYQRTLLTHLSTHLHSLPPLFAAHTATLDQCERTMASITEAQRTTRHSLDTYDRTHGHLDAQLRHLESNLASLQRAQMYLTMVDTVDTLANTARHLLATDALSATEPVLELVRIERQLGSVHELRRMVRTRIGFLMKELKERLFVLFDKSLTTLNWPHPSLQDSTSPAMEQFKALTENMILIQLAGEEVRGRGEGGGGGEEKENSLWITTLLLSPITRRFHYHFTGARKTNQLDKPEWYLTHVTELITLHTPFLTTVIQPVLRACHVYTYDVRVEFIGAMLELVEMKLRSVMGEVVSRPTVLRHVIDEVLAFEGRVREEMEYPEGRRGAIDLFTEPSYFDSWLSVDKSWVNSRLDALRSLSHPWRPLTRKEGGEEEEEGEERGWDGSLDPSLSDPLSAPLSDSLGSSDPPHDLLLNISTHFHPTLPTTQSAHAFIALVAGVTDRYRLLPPLALRLRFVTDLQFKLFSIYAEEVEQEYRRSHTILIKTLDTVHAHSDAWQMHGGILNSITYITQVVQDWSEQLLFVELAYYQMHREEVGEDATSSSLAHYLANRGVGNEDRIVPDEPVVGAGKEVVQVGTLFDPVLTVFGKLKDEMMERLIDMVVSHFRTTTKSYRRHGHMWNNRSAHTESDEHLPTSDELELSPSLVQPLVTLKLHLMAVHQWVGSSLHFQFWTGVASRLNQLIFDDIIQHHYFSRPGAYQFQHDMHSLQSLFTLYTRKPAPHFKLVTDAITILTLQATQAAELQSTLATLSLSSDRAAAHELDSTYGIRKLSVQQVETLLARQSAQRREERERGGEEGKEAGSTSSDRSAKTSPHSKPASSSRRSSLTEELDLS